MRCDCSKAVREATAPLLAEIDRLIIQLDVMREVARNNRKDLAFIIRERDATFAELRDALSEARQANAELSRRAISGDPTVFGRCMPMREGVNLVGHPQSPRVRHVQDQLDNDHHIPPGEQWP